MEPLLRDIEMPLVEVLVDMEWEGIAIDRALFAPARARSWPPTSSGSRTRSPRVAGEDLNLNSPRQLATVLFEKLQLPVLKKTKTGPSTDADVLEQLAAMGHELPRLILEYRELQKLKSTYVDALPARVNRTTGRIHTSFNQTGAATGRLSARPTRTCRTSRSARPRGEAIRRGFVPARGLALPGGGLLPDRAAPAWRTSRAIRPSSRLPAGRRHPPADRRAHLRRAAWSR